MLSISPIKSVDQAASYYMDQDNYYLQGEGQAFSEWVGKGADYLKLTGAVDATIFKALLEGKMPDGTQVGQMRDGSIKHRPGTDVTFSAPKSVSILAYLGKDDRLLVAHKAAVKTALDQLERLCGSARMTESGTTTIENTQNLIIGLFHHDTSRLYDPQMHSHAVIMNETLRSDGLWRALASSMLTNGEQLGGFGERLRAFQIYVSSIYRTELAKSVTDMGYSIRRAGPHGMWEMEQVPESVLHHFSKRAEQINAAGPATSPAYKDKLALLTREPKKAIDRGELHQYWQARMSELGFDAKGVVADINEQQQNQINPNGSKAVDNAVANTQLPNITVATQYVGQAIQRLSEYQTSFSFDQVFNRALSMGMGEVSYGEIKHVIDQQLKQGALLCVGQHGSRLTTQTLLNIEEKMMAQAAKLKDSRPTYRPSNKNASSELAKHIGQDRLSMVTVHAPRQFELLNEGLTDFEQQGYTLRLLAPNKFAANELKANVHRERGGLLKWFCNIGKPHIGESVKGYVFAEQQRQQSPLANFSRNKDLVVVDQAHKLSHHDLSNLLALAEQNGTRLLLLNNHKGVKSAQASIDLLTRAGVKNHRIKTPETKQRFNVEIHSQNAPLNIQSKNTLVLTDSKAHIDQLTQAMRNTLKCQGALDREEIKITSLTPKYVDKTRMASTNFDSGNVVRLYHRDRPFEDFTVLGRIKHEGRLQVAALHNNKLGRKTTLKMAGLKRANFRVFEAKEMHVAQGDRVRATATMQKLGLTANKCYEVQRIQESKLTLKEVGNANAQVVIGKRALSHLPLAHDYVRTLSQAAGHFDQVVLHSKATRLSSGLINELTGISKHISVYTDSVNQAERAISRVAKQMTATDMVMQKTTQSKVVNEEELVALKTQVHSAVRHLVNEQNKSALDKAIDQGIISLSEREAAFGSHQLFEVVSQHTMGLAGFDEIQQALQARVQSRELLKNQEGLVTTAEALSHKQALLDHLNDGKGKVEPIMTISHAKKLLAKKKLTPSQQQAASMVLSSRDQFVAIQGFAGTGKSTLLERVQAISGKAILGLAPTHKATFALQQKGIAAQTLQSFIRSAKDGEMNLNNKWVVLDEASQASNKDLLAFVQIIKAHGNRTLIQGDSSQFQAIGSGKPWDVLLAKANIDKAYCTDIVRQHNPDLKQAAEHITQGNVDQALKHIAKAKNTAEVLPEKTLLTTRAKRNIVDLAKIIDHSKAGENTAVDQLKNLHPGEHPNLDAIKQLEREAVLTAATQDYLALTPTERHNTLFVIQGHKERQVAHQLIRQGLKGLGELGVQEVVATRLMASHHGAQEGNSTDVYHLGQVISINNTFYTIERIDHKNKALHLIDDAGKRHIKFPEHLGDQVRCYDQHPSPLAIGEVIRATHSDKAQGIVAGTTYQVTEVQENKITLAELNSSTTRTINPNALNDGLWDYAYTTTGFSSQGLTAENKLSVYFSWQKNLTHIRAFGVSETRPVHNSMIYTDDQQKLKAQLQASLTQNHKRAALEVTGNPIRPNLTDRLPSARHSTSKITKSRKQTMPAKPKVQTPTPSINAKELAKALAKDVRHVAMSLLGEPNHHLSNANQLRYGNRGSLVINLTGPKQGNWHNFESGESGDLLSLIKTELQLPFKETLHYGKSLVGGITPSQLTQADRHAPAKQNTSETIPATQKWANVLMKQAKPIEGTLAHAYLSKVRGLSKVSSAQSSDVKFHPKVLVDKSAEGKNQYAPAMIAISRDSQGEPQGIQATYLNAQGKKLDTAIQKRSLGKLTGNHVTLAGKKENGVSFIAEGVETGLSVSQACNDAHVIATLGKHNMKNVDPNVLGHKVVLIADNDGQKLIDDKPILAAAKQFTEAGKQVSIVMPPSLDGKTDMNDVLQQQGVKGVTSVLTSRCMDFSLKDSTIHSPQNQDNQIIRKIKQSQEQHGSSKNSNELFALTETRARQSSVDREESKFSQADYQKIIPNQQNVGQTLQRQVQLEQEL